ncbi:MAG TPA: Flp pilus assembly protein CpaB [Chromatiales bacterium]|nr:Flp pilus assembly protein CpaB [Chromatiales bacterium]
MTPVEDSAPRKGGGNTRRNLLLLLLSLVIGGGGAWLAKGFIEKKVNYYRAQLEKTQPMVQVVVPVRDMRRGEIVTEQDLALREVPAEFAHVGAVRNENYQIAVGQRLSFDIAKGRPLLWAHLEGGLSPTFSGMLSEGMRALTVPVDEVNSISGFLQPGDNIDLFMNYQKAVFPVVQNLHILATGTRTVRDKTGQVTGTYQTITVEVAPEVAKKITLARSVGSITATLRNPQDAGPIDSNPYTVAQLLNKPPVVKKKRRILPKKKGIQYIIGGI